MSTIPCVKCWVFVSSKGDRRYQSLLYTDGSVSCDCPGWCRRAAADGSRSCRHTRFIEMGCADRECERVIDYRATPNGARPVSVPGLAPAARPSREAGRFGQMGRRKIHA